MDEMLYEIMDWAATGELVYSESGNPDKLLGPHLTENGLLIQVFVPTVVYVTVKLTALGKKYPMDTKDEAGVFAVLVPRKSLADYTLPVTYGNGVTEELRDPHAFPPLFNELDLKKFEVGIHYDIYEKMGAHVVFVGNVKGVYLAVWTPCVTRVSVVEDFNLWDDRRHQMRRMGDSGISELFMPGLTQGEIHKYEIKAQSGDPMLEANLYRNYVELRPHTALVVWDINQYQWHDKGWIDKRKRIQSKENPMSIYEVHSGSWIRKPVEVDENGEKIIGSEFYNYRELTEKPAVYVKEMGYTHMELIPVMEHPLDASRGYQMTGYYAPTSRYGMPDDSIYFMDYMYEQGVDVILDWVPAHLPKDLSGLVYFDGTCVYEHQDPRQGMHPHWGTLIYNYGCPQVANFLTANALFWARRYYVDGICMDAVASMLYLDYGKNDGGWVANIYGGNENLEVVEFLKHLSPVFKKRESGAVLIAEESTAWLQIIGDVDDGAVGFDYKWNMGWMNDFLGYMEYDPLLRCHHYGESTSSMLYVYSEDSIPVSSRDEVVHGKGSMVGKTPGERLEDKFANLRTAYDFMMMCPGKKLLSMGQDMGQISKWNENESLHWEDLWYEIHNQLKLYVQALNQLYTSHPVLYEVDYHPDGFEWTNYTSGQDNILVFLRGTKKQEENLLVVCSPAPAVHGQFKLGAPLHGKYKEIFNSDEERFGGQGVGNPCVKTSRKDECDERLESIIIQLVPLGIRIFSCTPVAEKVEPVKKAAAAKKSAAKKAAVKKAAAVKTETVMKEQPEAEAKAVVEGKPEVKAKATAKKKPATKAKSTPTGKTTTKAKTVKGKTK